MTQVLEQFQYAEALRILAEEVKAILEDGKFKASELVIKTNHIIGETIVTHPAYKKGKHGSGEVIKHLALLTGCSEAHLYLCIKFYEKYPEVSNALETLQPDKKNLTWRQVVATFKESEETGEDQTSCPHSDTYQVTMTICRKCGARVEEKHKAKEHIHATHS